MMQYTIPLFLKNLALLSLIPTSEGWIPTSNKSLFAMRQHAQQQNRPVISPITKTILPAAPADLEYNAERIRNFSIIAHIDHGTFRWLHSSIPFSLQNFSSMCWLYGVQESQL